ncbi:MAG: amidohydrolase family protein [Verrucomicrobiae bacterium]|nr:amidohydrolase family protein [Verrucomicrobiae bacterium]
MSVPPPPRRRRRLLVALTLLAAVGLLVARALLFQGPYQEITDLPDRPIVDLHCHIAGIGAGDSGCFVSPAMRANFRFKIYLDAFDVTEADLIEHGDMLVVRRLSELLARSRHVHQAVVLAMDGPIDASGELARDRTEVYIPNDFVAAAVKHHTNLLFGASVHPLRHDALERLDKVVAQGAVLLKWLPSIMDIDPADPRLMPFYQRLAHHRLPLLTHTGGERSFTTARDALADPLRLRLPLSLGVTVIAAHAGAGGENEGESDFDRLRHLMREFPNLHADISALTQVNRLGALRDVLAAPECRGRLVYGSDFPLINTALVSPWYHPLHIPLAERQKIADLDNPWDRDVQTKKSLGVPQEVFTLGESLLRR